MRLSLKKTSPTFEATIKINACVITMHTHKHRNLVFKRHCVTLRNNIEAGNHSSNVPTTHA